MKKIVLLSCLSFFFLASEAQTKKTKKRSTAKKAIVQKKSQGSAKDSNTVTLATNSSNAAYSANTSTQLRIADPTINILNLRAAGAPVNTGHAIVGMPKATYGIANGKILLRNTTATTPGTAYGSGSVATGTSIAGAGTSEATIGVNGKSPYAGTWLWGDRRPAYTVQQVDSVRRQ